jgi:transketolase
LLGDLGFGLFDDIRNNFSDRCINLGSSEQLIVGAATGMALQGKIPVCYSITPFILYRPFEFIRNYLNIEGVGVKLVGSGRDTDYLAAGYTHHAVEARAILKELTRVSKFFPESESELRNQIGDFVYKPGPAFLSLTK